MRRICNAWSPPRDVAGRVGTPARAALYALSLVAAATARGETDASFRLSAGLEDLPAYFPAYLANGYISTLSGPRGTEATRAYLVAFMDYAAGDISVERSQTYRHTYLHDSCAATRRRER